MRVILSKAGLASRGAIAGVLLFASRALATDAQFEEDRRQADGLRREAETDWVEAGSPGEFSPEGQAFVDAAIHDFRPDLVEQVLAGGDVLRRMLPVPRGGKRVRLRVVRAFTEFHARLDDEMFGSLSHSGGWVARRITKDAVEVWNVNQGWLFDGQGRLRGEARPPRDSGYGRQWFGAFLPDGQWVTTDLDEMDGTLYFYQANGKERRTMRCEELAPPPDDGGSKLLGWGRSDREGRGWVVNVGSEYGWATVWVGPEGPARVLKPGERWALCHPRALGPRGWYLSMDVPSDGGRYEIQRSAAGHGSHVGYPEYASISLPWDNAKEPREHVVPDGNDVFGFWPGAKSFFIGAESRNAHEVSGARTRKYQDITDSAPVPIIDKTWFFDVHGKLERWVRARRIGDAADGRAMLFRVTADSRVMTLGSDLRVKATRRFVWKDGSTADAVALWDDLRLGLFIRRGQLVLVRWSGAG